MVELVGLRANLSIVHAAPDSLEKIAKVGREKWLEAAMLILAFRSDKFVIDAVVSSSELLSDVGNSNVITFDDVTNVNTNELHEAYVASVLLVVSLLLLACLVRLEKIWKISIFPSIRICFQVTIIHFKANGTVINYNMIISFLKRTKKMKNLNDHGKHWLRGNNSSFFEENHINLKNHQLSNGRPCNTLFSKPLEINIDNDMYYSVNFGSSQRSPLIQWADDDDDDDF
jgi:hypothetical protein